MTVYGWDAALTGALIAISVLVGAGILAALIWAVIQLVDRGHIDGSVAIAAGCVLFIGFFAAVGYFIGFKP